MQRTDGQTDRGTDTTDLITYLANAVGNIAVDKNSALFLPFPHQCPSREDPREPIIKVSLGKNDVILL